MTISDYSATAFALLNGARIIAYAPQIRCLTRDNDNAKAVSLVTWTLFALANAATVAYAVVVLNDLLMAGVFVLNLIGCTVIVALIARKRILRARAGRLPGKLFKRLMLSWRRRAQRRLDLHLMLTLPSKRTRYREDDCWPPRNDKFRHHPDIRE